MSKKIVVFAMAMAFMAGSATISFAKTECTVTAVEGTKVTMDCGDAAKDMSVGSKVNVKSAKKKAIEGC